MIDRNTNSTTLSQKIFPLFEAQYHATVIYAELKLEANKPGTIKNEKPKANVEEMEIAQFIYEQKGKLKDIFSLTQSQLKEQIAFLRSTLKEFASSNTRRWMDRQGYLDELNALIERYRVVEIFQNISNELQGEFTRKFLGMLSSRKKMGKQYLPISLLIACIRFLKQSRHF